RLQGRGRQCGASAAAVARRGPGGERVRRVRPRGHGAGHPGHRRRRLISLHRPHGSGHRALHRPGRPALHQGNRPVTKPREQTVTNQNTAWRAVTWLVGAYVVLSGLTVVAIATFADIAPTLVNPQAWVRGIIVAATSLLTFVFARRAAAGSARALL